jgi:hypothetical protein
MKKIFSKSDWNFIQFCSLIFLRGKPGGIVAFEQQPKVNDRIFFKESRISSKRHPQFSLLGFWHEFYARYASPPRGSALYFKRICQGFLKSRKSFCSRIWKLIVATQRNPAERNEPIFLLALWDESEAIILVPKRRTA